jgi:hypothetical protein
MLTVTRSVRIDVERGRFVVCSRWELRMKSPEMGATGRWYLGRRCVRRIRLSAASTSVDSPNYYADWTVDEGRAILWHTYDLAQLDRELTGTVDIAQYQVGVGKVADIGVAPAADGYFGWSPQSSGIAPDTQSRYDVRITWNGDSAVFDQSREAFSVPVTGDDYFVNIADAEATQIQRLTAYGNAGTGCRSPRPSVY